MGQHWSDVHERLQRTGSTPASPDMQYLLSVSGSDLKAGTEKDHVPGLVGKCLRQDTFRPLIHFVSHVSRQGDDISSPKGHDMELEQNASPTRMRSVRSGTEKVEGSRLSDSEEESPETSVPAPATAIIRNKRELLVARRALRKWWRLAGLNRPVGPEMRFEIEEELGVAWTRGICPQVEGRIVIVGECDKILIQ